MYAVSNEYKTHINNSYSRSTKSKLVIDGVEYLDDVIMTCPKISYSNSAFIGGFPSKICTFDIKNVDGTLDLHNKWIEVYRGLYFNGNVEWVPMGIFKAINGDDIITNKSNKTITFKGYDKRQLLDTPYVTNLDWSTSHTGLEIIQEICSNCGLELENTTFGFSDYVFTSPPNFSSDATNTDAASRLAEIGGEIALITRKGKVQIKGPTLTNETIPIKKREKLTKENMFGPVNTVVLGKEGIDDDIVYPETIEGDRIEKKILDNPYVDLIREDIIEEVANHIIGMSITPFSITNFIDDFIYDLNDVMSAIDDEGNTFNATILEYETISRLKSNVSAPAQTEALTEYSLAGSSKQSLNKVKLQVNHNTQEITALATKVETIETDSEDEFNSIREEIVISTTQIQQTTEEIVSSALKEYVKNTDYETFKETIQTTILQTNEDITFSFNTLTSVINSMDTDVQEQFHEISKYIRFDGGISLGEIGNDVTLRIENDVIYFSVAGVSVMAITPNGIEIDSAKFRYKVEVGSFAFINEDDGSFSLVKV